MPQPHGLDPHGPDMTVDQVAERLQVSSRTVYRYLAKGLLPGAWHTEKAWRVPQQTVSDYIVAKSIPY